MGTEDSVETCWFPLTPEHGFPSLHSSKAQGAPPQPAAACPQMLHSVRLCLSFPKNANKKQETLRGLLQKIINTMTSYGGIIRIR